MRAFCNACGALVTPGPNDIGHEPDPEHRCADAALERRAAHTAYLRAEAGQRDQRLAEIERGERPIPVGRPAGPWEREGYGHGGIYYGE